MACTAGGINDCDRKDCYGFHTPLDIASYINTDKYFTCQ